MKTLLVSVCVLMSMLAFAQQQSPFVRPLTVLVSARTTTGGDQSISATDFAAKINSIPVKVTKIEPAATSPLELTVVVDASGSSSSTPFWAAEVRQIPSLLRGLDAAGMPWQARMIVSREKPETLVDFTNDAKAFEDSLPKIRSQGRSAVFDALYEATLPVASTMSEHPPRRVILLISSGLDHTGRTTMQKALASARKNSVTIYPMSVWDTSPYSNHEDELGPQVGDGYLQMLAFRTGGAYLHVAKEFDIATAIQAFLHEMTNQYVVTLITSEPLGKKLNVQVKSAKSGMTVQMLRVDLLSR